MHQAGPLGKVWVYIRSLGPGLIVGAADDDPSGIGTYAQTGAHFGYAQLWTSVLCLPLMIAIQEICARIALQTGQSLTQNMRRHYPRWIMYACVGLLFVANTINIGADLGAMAASAQMLLALPYLVWLLAITALIVVLQVSVPYPAYARFLRYATLSLFAYILVAFWAKLDWHLALRSTVIPLFRTDADYLMNIVAFLGTSITPYCFFWQADQEVEEEIAEGKTSAKSRVGTSAVALKWMRSDVVSGMVFSQVACWFIVATTAATLHVHGILDIDSAPKAAEALRPLAGNLAYLLFAAGIIGTGLLAVPILAGSAAYAASQSFRIRASLSLDWPHARVFYGVIALATGIGMSLNFIGINPMKALYYSAVINGVIAPPLMIIIMLISGNHRIMKGRTNRGWSKAVGWAATVIMSVAAIAMALQLLLGHAGG
jgi:NRAMP (natural resistance-associated macrophage protein)-like metal ion transporter